MADFATRAELASHLQVADVDNGTADLALAAASAEIRAECGWSITQETVTAEAHPGGGPVIFLPTLWLTAVSAVVENGVTLTAADFTFTRSGALWRARSSVRGGRWYDTGVPVLVTYTHGLPAGSTHPWLALAKAECLRRAGLVYLNPQRLRSETVGGVSQTWASDPLAGPVSPLALLRLPVVA